jgi:hypothetical protein
MERIVLYKIQKPILITKEFTTDTEYAKLRSEQGYKVTGSIFNRYGNNTPFTPYFEVVK